MKLWQRIKTWLVEAIHERVTTPALEDKLKHWGAKHKFELSYTEHLGLYSLDNGIYDIHVEVPDGPVGNLKLTAWETSKPLDDFALLERSVPRATIIRELKKFYKELLKR